MPIAQQEPTGGKRNTMRKEQRMEAEQIFLSLTVVGRQVKDEWIKAFLRDYFWPLQLRREQ